MIELFDSAKAAISVEFVVVGLDIFVGVGVVVVVQGLFGNEWDVLFRLVTIVVRFRFLF